MWLWRWNSIMRMMLNRMMTLGEILWVDWIYSIFTQTPVEDSLSRNILDFEFIGIKMTRTIIMQKNLWTERRFMAIVGTWRTFLRTKLWYFVEREALPIWLIGRVWPLPTVICSGPLYCDWTKRLPRLAVRWSEVPESASQGSWLLSKQH